MPVFVGVSGRCRPIGDGCQAGCRPGVGGFLGIGEKDVAVRMTSIRRVQDGRDTKLTVNITKDEFTAAPAYDRKMRRFMN